MSEKSKKSSLLASDSDEEDGDNKRKNKLSLLDALGDDTGKGDNKKQNKKAAVKALLDDSDEEDDFEDIFGRQKNPPAISNRRPKVSTCSE